MGNWNTCRIPERLAQCLYVGMKTQLLSLSAQVALQSIFPYSDAHLFDQILDCWDSEALWVSCEALVELRLHGPLHRLGGRGPPWEEEPRYDSRVLCLRDMHLTHCSATVHIHSMNKEVGSHPRETPKGVVDRRQGCGA